MTDAPDVTPAIAGLLDEAAELNHHRKRKAGRGPRYRRANAAIAADRRVSSVSAYKTDWAG